MADRLSPLDTSFLYFEEPTTPMHVGGVATFARPRRGYDFGVFVRLVEQRLGLVPRYRQRILPVPGHLGNPVWADDTAFDIDYHIRQSALPRPGSDQQLADLVARLMSRRLDRRRPLWEMYWVEGLAGGRIALIAKTHHAMVDGISAVDLSQVILDPTPRPRKTREDLWMPMPTPTPAELVLDALAEIAGRPSAVADAVRGAVLDARSTAERVARAVGGLAAAAMVAARPAPESPLNVPIGTQRRFAMARTELDDYKRVRKQQGGTVNDVVLATVAGGLRGFLMSRGEPVTGDAVIRAMVPVSVRGQDDDARVGNQISSYFVDLPVGEPDPVVRLSRISYAMRAHKEAGQAIGAAALARLSGFAPPTLHALGARAANGLARRIFNVVVSNVPGPQVPLYAAGARMLEVFPVVPLAKGQALAIGVTSYNGSVYYGLNADRDALGDVNVVAAMVEESLAELVGTVR